MPLKSATFPLFVSEGFGGPEAPFVGGVGGGGFPGGRDNPFGGQDGGGQFPPGFDE